MKLNDYLRVDFTIFEAKIVFFFKICVIFLVARPDPHRGRNPDADRTRTSRRHGGQIASQVTPPHVVRPGNFFCIKVLLVTFLSFSYIVMISFVNKF